MDDRRANMERARDMERSDARGVRGDTTSTSGSASWESMRRWERGGGGKVVRMCEMRSVNDGCRVRRGGGGGYKM